MILLLVACTSLPKDPAADDTGETAGGPSVTLLAGGFARALDATPTADGDGAWFVGEVDGEGLWRLDGEGAPVAAGTFAGPRALVSDGDASTLYVAAEDGVTVVTTDGSEPPETVLDPVASGFTVLAMDHANVAGTDWLYLAGLDAEGGAGVVRVSPGGGAPAAVLLGAPLVHPTGVVVAADGTAWVADERDGADGALVRVRQGEGEVVAEGFVAGSPAGVALSADESLVLVSSVSPEGTSQVVIVEIATGEVTTFDGTIGENVGSGGLHGLDGTGVYAWCGVTSGGAGAVYRVGL